MIENGRITSVVIIDRAGDGYIGPDNDHEGISQYDAVVPYVIAGNWDEESAVDAIYQELIDQDYQVLDVIDNGRTYTFETKKGVVSRDFVWDVTYYENVYAVGDVISNGVSNDQGAEASVNTSYLVPGESITFTYDRDGNWQNSSYTVSFTVGGRTVSGVTLKIDGTVATATFTVPYNLTDGDVTLNTI